MSRIGKKTIVLPEKVKVGMSGQSVAVEGPRGKLTVLLHPHTRMEVKDNTVVLFSTSEEPEASAIHGMMRAVMANMVIGVSKGFQKFLDINGVGYRAEVKGNKIVFALGYSHPIEVEIPKGIKVTVDKQTAITLESNDCEQLGQFAADIRKLRPPEPYKGKGIKYRDEVIVRKVGKTAGK